MTSWSILTGDVRDRLDDIADGSARTCVTSPPYFGLRDYGHDGQIGLEPTPDEFVAAMLDVFRKVRRVLADDGSAWLNLGDSYAATTGGIGNNPSTSSTLTTNGGRGPKPGDKYAADRGGRAVRLRPGCKPKDLIGIPWMVAFALRADGWYLRSDVIWHKPNPMPESTRDRPTSAHEHVFLLTKAPRYYYDQDAIRQPLAAGSAERIEAGFRDRYADGAVDGRGYRGPVGGEAGMQVPEKGANARNVWSITSKPFKGAHFACMPPDLAERCILAGSAEGDTVLDPFAGAGTTAVVALRHGRSFVGTELNPEYVEIARRRIVDDAPLFNTTAEVAA